MEKRGKEDDEDEEKVKYHELVVTVLRASQGKCPALLRLKHMPIIWNPSEP